jgi:thioredoxin 1
VLEAILGRSTDVGQEVRSLPQTGTPSTVRRRAKVDKRPTLVFFSSRRSGPARRMASLVAWIHVTEKNRLRVLEVDADKNEPLMRALDVDTVPALVLLDDSRVLARHEGRATGRQIERLIRAHVPA